jgi:hypothetical protein
MVEAQGDGVSVAGEIYELDLEHLEHLMAAEPPGLGLRVVQLASNERTLGIFWVAPDLPQSAVDISRFGGWREYRRAQH